MSENDPPIWLLLQALVIVVALYGLFWVARFVWVRMNIGTTIWVEHRETGDISHKIKLVLEKMPQPGEHCKFCGKQEMVNIGTLIQHGILDHKIYAVMVCNNCQSITAFVYHVEARDGLYPEEGYEQPPIDL